MDNPGWRHLIRHTGDMNLIEEVRRLGGAARIATLRERGFSDYALRGAIGGGELLRPRGGWVAIRNLEPELLFAVKHGVVLSCVSMARRLGLWVAEKPQHLHVATRTPGSQVRAAARVHWGRPLILRAPGAIEDSLPNALGYIADCLPREEALAVWESAINRGLADLQSLQRLPLSSSARDLLSECRPYSDSGLESLFKTRLRWLRVPIRAQTWLFGHRVDFLIGDRLVVQIDGKQHGGEQKASDYAHDALLTLKGYKIIRVSYSHVMHDWPAVQELVLEALAQGWHLRVA